jgi:hypothetical protein
MAEMDPLHLAVLVVGDKIMGIFLVGDTVVIKAPTTIPEFTLISSLWFRPWQSGNHI